jgi:phosphatidylglycerophosphate synthase
MKVGGLTVLERVLRALVAGGVRHAVVLAEPLTLSGGLDLTVEWAAADTTTPSGVPVVRGDEVAGIRVVDERSRRRAEWALLRTLPKSFQGPVDGLLNWRVSLRITRLVARTSLSPNHVTLLATAVGLVACALALRGFPWLALGGLLLQLHSVLDSCDGELARLKHRKSRLGQWLDNVTDDLVDNLFMACASLGASGPWAALGVGGAALRLLGGAYVYAAVYRRTGTGDVYTFRWWFERDRATIDEVYDPRRPLTWLRALGRRDTYVLLFMVFSLCDLPRAIAAYGGLAGAVALVLVAQQIRHA